MTRKKSNGDSNSDNSSNNDVAGAIERRVGRQESYSAMTPISIDIPDDDEESDEVHETIC